MRFVIMFPCHINERMRITAEPLSAFSEIGKLELGISS